jgi:hypothetical protein
MTTTHQSAHHKRQTPSRRTRNQRHMRTMNRIVLLCSAIFIPLYLAIRLTGGSAAKLEELPDLLSRIKTPVVWEVPEDGVRYETFFHGYPDDGNKYVVVRVQMEARMKIGYDVVPRCFQLVDNSGLRHYPLSHSPIFIHLGDKFSLDRGDTLDEELLFEIPEAATADRLTFERFQE